MEKKRRVLAFDFGASSGRAMIGNFNGETIELEEIHRFSNDPVTVNGTMYWDVLRLFHEIKQGILKAKHAGGFDSIGIDTWGVDFGLLDEDGKLLENPVHYRDARTAGMLNKSFDKINPLEFYQITGNQFMEINTVFQLMSILSDRPNLLKRTETLLMMPDLLNYFLTGEKVTEYSIASTTQMLDARQYIWSDKVLEKLRIPKRILTDIVPCGTKVGKLTKEICEELDVEPVEVIAVAGHDTQDALVSVPAYQDDFIFISCGTWSLFGTELDKPLINDKTRAYNITNEGGYGKKASFLKNIIGLWLIQESRRQWIREGKEYGFGELEQMAAAAQPFKCFIDPDAPEFVPAGNIPGRIRDYCQRTGQYIPETEAEIVRCIDESLALKYRNTYEQIVECTGKKYDAIHMVGGGVQSRILCQMTAGACDCKVIAGPVEATVLGNIALQLMTLGDIKDIKEARQIIRQSQEILTYEPENIKQWDEAYTRYQEVTTC